MTYVIIKNEEKNQSYSRSVKAVEELDLEAFSSNSILAIEPFRESINEQRGLRQARAFAQSRQNLHCSYT